MQPSLVGGPDKPPYVSLTPSEDHSHGCCWRRLRPFRCGVRRQNRKVPGNGDCPSEQRAYEQKGRRLCTAHRYLCKAPSRIEHLALAKLQREGQSDRGLVVTTEDLNP